MNYIWNILINAEQRGLDRRNITFKEAEIYSPYMEMAFENINEMDFDENSIIEINPWYRFYDIFKDLFNINLTENKELREVLFDILIHYLGNIDSNIGLCKKQVCKNLLLKDINAEVYGEYLNKNISAFSSEELDCFLDGLINLYSCNTSLIILKKVLRKVFKNNIVYINKDKPKDVYIYLGVIYSTKDDAKITMIINTFLPINMNPFVFWDKHFGILGVEKTMKLDEIVMVN